MPTRLAKVSELNLLLGFRHKTWGSRRDTFKSWSIGDEIALVVGKSLAGLAVVSGQSFRSDEQIWPDDLYPYRLPISFKNFILSGHRPPLLGEVREALMASYGAKWGFAMINQTAIPQNAALAIQAIFASSPNHLRELEGSLDSLIEEARIGHDIEQQQRPRAQQVPSLDEPVQPDAGPEIASPQEESLHTRAQGALIELGRAARCSIWVASNDRGKLFKGAPLGDRSLKTLPATYSAPKCAARTMRYST